MFEPQMLIWNRIEPHPRGEDIEESLRAEIRDPLWILSRQWQFGEFQGEDAGMAASVRLRYKKHIPAGIRSLDGPAVAYDGTQHPLEAVIECVEPELDLLSRAEIGRQWIRILERNLAASQKGPMIEVFRQSPFLSFKEPADFNPYQRFENADLLADEEYRNILSVLIQEKNIDGSLLIDIIAADHLSLSTYVLGEQQLEIDTLGGQLLDWVRRTYHIKKKKNPYWSSLHLEHQFEVAMSDAVTRPSLVAKEYLGDGLDWYQFDWNGTVNADSTNTNEVEEQERQCYPSAVKYQGMPGSRWWELEEKEVNFGQIKGDLTNLGALLFTQFNLVYSNDWLTIPFQAETGALHEITSMVVTDNFGVQTLIRSIHETVPNENWGLFQLHHSDRQASQTADKSCLFIPPLIDDLQKSQPLEQIHFIRDEMANMVWAVEHLIPDQLGEGRSGAEYAAVVASYLAKLKQAPGPDLENEAIVRYQLASRVPENWIPFIPVKMRTKEQASRQIQLQRASLPRVLEGFKPMRIRPQSTLLKEGLQTSRKTPLYIYEEEIPRSGTIVKGVWKRVRWFDGRTIVWYGYEKTNGRGEGRSQLKFDQLLDK